MLVLVCIAEKSFSSLPHSHAHARARALVRVQVYRGIPDGLDILLTHVAPGGPLATSEDTDACLDAALRAKSVSMRPRLHCFGHAHETFGVCVNPTADAVAAGLDDWTVCMNAAQGDILAADRDGGGVRLVCVM